MTSLEESGRTDELQRGRRGQKPAGVVGAFADSRSQRSSIKGVESVGESPLQGERLASKGEPRSGAEPGESEDKESGRGFQANNQRERESQPFGLDKDVRNRIKWEDYLIGLLLQNPGLCPHVCGIINDGDFAGTDTRELYRIFNSVYQRDSSPLFQSFEQFVPSALLETVIRARKSVESRSPLEASGLVKAAVQCATSLKRAHLLQSNTELQYLVRGAEEAGDVAAVQQCRRQLLG